MDLTQMYYILGQASMAINVLTLIGLASGIVNIYAGYKLRIHRKYLTQTKQLDKYEDWDEKRKDLIKKNN